MGDGGRRNWWIAGCLILPALLVLLVGTLAGWVWWSARLADPRSSTLVQERSDREPAAGAPLELLLELDSCEVYIEPGAPGEPLGVEAHYDARDYRLEEITDPLEPNTYRLRFLVVSSRWITGIKQGIYGGQPQLRIRLPVDTPIRLELVQRNGGALVDLGGLQVDAAEFDVAGALLKVDADEPMRGDLDRFSVTARQGALVLESLDRMQPRRIAIDFRMGEAQLDFRGDWAADTTVDLSLGMADAIVRLPRDARVVGLGDRRLRPLAEEELGRPTLTFHVDSGTRTQLRVFE